MLENLCCITMKLALSPKILSIGIFSHMFSLSLTCAFYLVTTIVGWPTLSNEKKNHTRALTMKIKNAPNKAALCAMNIQIYEKCNKRSFELKCALMSYNEILSSSAFYVSLFGSFLMVHIVKTRESLWWKRW